jgi:hypothetical protein
MAELSSGSLSVRFCCFILLLALSVVLVSCSTPATWTEGGPAFGGRLDALAVADSVGNTLVVASPGGGVWRSTDGGATWTFPAQYGLGDSSGVHLEWDAVTPGRLFLLTWNGLYATTNNGDSWMNLVNPGGFPAPLQLYQAAIADPKPFAQMVFSTGANPQRAVFAAIPCSGLFYSFDGVSFTQTWPFSGGSSNPDNCIGTIAADPYSGRVYFSTLTSTPTSVAHVFRSNCAAPWSPGSPCLTWQPANGGLPTYAVISTLTSVATSKTTADHLVAQTTGTSSSLSTYMTTDGQTWTLQSTQPDGWSPRALVYGGHGQELFEGNVTSFYSNNFGSSWSDMNVSAQHPDVRAVTPVAAAGKVWTTTDGSMSGTYANITRWNWTPGSIPTSGTALTNSTLTVLQAYFAGVVPVGGAAGSARRVFVGSQDNASFCNDTLGPGGWTTSGSPPGLGAGDIFGFASAPSDPNRAYAWSDQGTGFAMTTNASSAATCGAVNWTSVTPTQSPANAGMSNSMFWSHHDLAVHPTNPDRLYIAELFDVAETTNASAPSPVLVHHTLPNNLRPTVVYVDASGAIYVGTIGQGAYKSTDDGTTWTAFGPGVTPQPAVVTAITSSGGANPTFWIATTSGLYKSGSGGSWTLATGGGGYTVSDVTVDPSCTTRVYAAFGYVFVFGQHRGGIEFSSDNGATWSSITSGQIIHQGPVSMVQVDPTQANSVYAAAYGRGFWVYNWGSQLPACAQ